MSKHAAADHLKFGIALQGGGSHGAYTKGVLKALFGSRAFTAPHVEIAAVSGTSAGAVNASLLVAGLNNGGPQDAIARLDRFWNDTKASGMNAMLHLFNPHYPNLPPQTVRMMDDMPDGTVTGMIRDSVSRVIPDWSKLQNGSVKLFVNAVAADPVTDARRHVVFKGKKLGPDAVAASAGLEMLGGHVIDGVKYYDGAYWRNPCTADLEKADITDLLVITLQKKPDDAIPPVHQDKLRKQFKHPGRELLTNELFHHVEWLRATRPDLRVHVISLPVKPTWNNTSKLNNDARWIDELEAAGLKDGQAWLKAHSALLPTPKAPPPGKAPAP